MKISTNAVAFVALSCCYMQQTNAFVSPKQQHSSSFLQVATTPTPTTSESFMMVDTSTMNTDDVDMAATNFAGTIASSAAARGKQSENAVDPVDEELESVEFPPPLSAFDRMQRAATFWSTAIPIVANYYGLIGNIKLQEVLGSQVAEDDIEVR